MTRMADKQLQTIINPEDQSCRRKELIASFHTKVAGTSNYPTAVWLCKPGAKVTLTPEPNNPHDRNAIAVVADVTVLFFIKGQAHIGYLNAELAKEIGEHLKNGGRVAASIANITGGTPEKPTRGVNLLITKE